MAQDVALISFAILLFVLIPLVPKLVIIRIRFLRWVKWNKIADWHERNSVRLVPVIRSVMFVVAVYLIGVVVI